MSTEEALARYHAESPDYRRGYDEGWTDAYKELDFHHCHETIPPLLRRFFWYPASKYDAEHPMPRLWERPTDAMTDEHCNPVFGVRMPGGMLFIRYGRKVRHVYSPPCKQCVADGVIESEAPR